MIVATTFDGSPDAIAAMTDLVLEGAPAPLVTVQGSRTMRAVRMQAFRRALVNGTRVMVREPTSLVIGHYWSRVFGDAGRHLEDRDPHPTIDAENEARRVARELLPAIGKVAAARIEGASAGFYRAWGDGSTEAGLRLARQVEALLTTKGGA